MKLILGLLFISVSPLHAKFPAMKDVPISYEEFIRKLDAGEVRSVVIDGDSIINGIYTVGGVDHTFTSMGSPASASDPLLIKLLAAKGISPTLAVPREEEYRETLVKIGLLCVMPLLILICVFNNTRTLRRLEKRIPPGPGW